MFPMPSPRVRAYIYALGTPIGALLTFYGVISEQEVALWLGLLGVALLTGEGGLAVLNTSTKKEETDGPHSG